MSNLGSRVMRLAVDVTGANPLIDKLTSGTPRIPRGTDLQLQLAFFRGTTLLALSDIASVTVELRDAATRLIASVSKTVAAAAFEICDDTTWADDSAQQVSVALAPADTNLGTGLESSHWLVISVITTDGKVNTCAGTNITIWEDGTGAGTTDPPEGVTYYTAAEVLALLDAKLNFATGKRLAIDTDGNITVEEVA